MNKRSKQQSAFLLLLAMVFTGAMAQAGDYIVKLKSATQISQLNALNSTKSPFQVVQLHGGNLLNLKFKPGITAVEESKQLETLRQSGDVEYVARNFEITLGPIDSQDFNWGSSSGPRAQWGLEKIRAPQAWKIMSGNTAHPIRVAVLDTGVDANHINLKGQVLEGYDFVQDDNIAQDENGHGTHCAGVIGGIGTAKKSTRGVAPGVKIVPVRMLDKKGRGDQLQAIKAIDYAIAQKVDVISASWGAYSTPEDAKPLVEAIERAAQAGIVFVAAAANFGADNDAANIYPANAGVENVITVAATSENDSKPRWSNYGQKVDIAAPGVGIISTVPKNKYKKMSGTSMSAPHVAGLVALLKGYSPGLSPAQLKEVVVKSGAHLANMRIRCGCRIDALNAIELVRSQN